MSTTTFDTAVPFRWPSQWNEPGLVAILSETPVNCLLDAPAAVAQAAKARGILTATRDEAAKRIQFLPDPQWPGVRPRKARGDGADAGPTGAPWVDANGWNLRLAHALMPGKRIWVEAVPEKGVVHTDASYLLATAEPQAFGAQWVICLDDAFAKSLAAGEAAAKARWTKMMDTSRFFASQPARPTAEPCASLAVVSDFSGDNEFLGKECLNMADRMNILYRIVPKREGFAVPPRIASILFVDEQAPDPAIASALRAFVRNGGLLIASKGSGTVSWGDSSAPSPLPGYTMRGLGKGRIAVPDTAWSDPWVLATEVRILIGRRTDVLRFYNEGMVGAAYGRSKDDGLIRLVNYGGRRSYEQLTLATSDEYTHARIVSLEHPAPQDIKVIARRERFCEIPVPAFAVYSAIDLRRS